MTRFIGSTVRRLTCQELDDIKKVYPNNFKWVTEGEFKWLHNGVYITVPKGFLSDGSSGGPDFGYSWLIHDWLYATHVIGDRLITREEADIVMIDILKWERAYIYYHIVDWLTRLNPFNKFSNSWRRGSGPKFLQDVYTEDVESASVSEDNDENGMKEVPLD